MAYWIKQFGRARDGVADAWLEQAPERGRSQSFPANNRPSGIVLGDRMVLRPVGWRHFCAVVEVASPILWRDGPESWRRRWPWLVEVRLLRASERVSDGPTLSELDVSPLSLRQHSHVRLAPEQGRRAEELIPAWRR